MPVVVLSQWHVLVSLFALLQNITHVHEKPRLVPLANIIDLVRFNLTVLDHFAGHYDGLVQRVQQSFNVLVLLGVSAGTLELVHDVLQSNHRFVMQADVSVDYKCSIKSLETTTESSNFT